MDSNKSKNLCPINSPVVRDALKVPKSFFQNMEDFTEENVIKQYRHVAAKEKHAFLSKSLKPKNSIENEHFPLDINMFNEKSHWVLS